MVIRKWLIATMSLSATLVLLFVALCSVSVIFMAFAGAALRVPTYGIFATIGAVVVLQIVCPLSFVAASLHRDGRG